MPRCPRPSDLLTALVLLSLSAPAARSGVEEVVLQRAGQDDAVIQRGSGERWRLDLRQGCRLDLRGYVGRTVLLWSPGPRLSTESRLLLPELDLSCPVWGLDSLARGRHPAAAPPEPTEALQALRQALELLGYDCGPPAQTGSRLMRIMATRRGATGAPRLARPSAASARASGSTSRPRGCAAR